MMVFEAVDEAGALNEDMPAMVITMEFTEENGKTTLVNMGMIEGQ